MIRLIRLLPRSLNARMLYMAVLGMVAGLLMYLAVLSLGSLQIQNVYMSDTNVAHRKAEILSDFSAFVSANGVTGKETSAVARWTGEHQYVTVIIYGSDSRRIHFSEGSAYLANGDSSYDPTQFGRLYPVRFTDGVYQVAIQDNSQLAKQQLVDIISVSMGCVLFILLTLLYARHLTRRIVSLSREAAAVSGGELERSISAPGGDEISALAASMDEMRRSVIQRMGNESRAWQANSELITAISHDIRTPMTSMIGYLGLLTESDFEDKERCRQFADTAYSKAMELKYLTDELFRYFLVFGKAELSMDMEKLDGRLLWEQLIGEAEFDMQDAGFKVKRMDFEGEAQVEADPMYLMRVVNNLVSNVKKYADPQRYVVIMSELRENRLSLAVSNSVPPEAPRTESTKIGLMTCRKIMEAMRGSFETRVEDEHFMAELSIPVITKT